MEVKTYENGLNDAWEAAKNIFLALDDGGFTREHLNKIFGTRDEYCILKNTPVREAVNKINAWKRTHEFNVNDVVGYKTYRRLGVVLEVRHDKVKVFWEDLEIDFCSIYDVERIGRTADVGKLISEIRGE